MSLKPVYDFITDVLNYEMLLQYIFVELIIFSMIYFKMIHSCLNYA